LPRPTFPADLPVSAHREAIAAAIQANPVLIVCGETGSGKTTQLPKICLSIGRGVDGLIGHTQPRRIAARSTAARIADELGTPLGEQVGYKIRFTDRTSERGYVKLMTDGILLAETQTDPDLRQYDTLIIDEAHERSLNIDFLLGYLKGVIARRPEFRLIVTSATIDASRFSRHFGDAPVIEVSGRLYPVEVRYRPPDTEDDDRDQDEDLAALVHAVDELSREGPGDILVFLPGEREIRDAADHLRRHVPPATEILPLYARLSVAEQERVFRPSGARRIVLATNVAETSLTVPGIRYVIDSGLARIKRYSYRNKVEQLQVERISQAAANQRSGRCGRVAAGVCIRLYDEEDFARRPVWTDPEVLRSSLAAVILRMRSLGLAEVERFPFIDPPAPRAIADGYALLQELGAIDEARALTPIGRSLAALPVDPRVARMVLAARSEGCLAEVIVIAAALSVQDPRERPLERAQAADEAHRLLGDERSDFISFLKIWAFFETAAEGLSQRKQHRLCHDHFLSATRMREWRDVVAQLRELVADLPHEGRRPRITLESPRQDPALHAPIHRALLAGLLGNIGLKLEEGGYLGARGIRFQIHPGSRLAKKQPRWVMAAEMTETSRLYARCVAGIDPVWIESVGAHLLRRHQADPHWEKRAAQVVALERGTVYGIPVYINRRVDYGRIDPAEARRIFIRSGLVEGDFDTRAAFFQHNRRLITEIEKLEAKSRRPDVLVDDDLIQAFYDGVIAAEVRDGQTFERWRERAERERPRLLYLERESLMRHEAAGITTEHFPSALELAGRRFPLDYEHDPGGTRDGVTLSVPLVALNQISVERCDWLVPGLLAEKVQQLARTLPQKLRHRLGPLPAYAAEFIEAEGGAMRGSLVDAIIRHARSARQIDITRDAFRPEVLPSYLSMNMRVLDEHGRQLAMGRNLAQIRQELGADAGRLFRDVAAEAIDEAEGDLSTDWTFGTLDEVMEIRRGSTTLVGYPAVVDRGQGVVLQVFDSPELASAEHRAGLVRLFRLALKEPIRQMEKGLPGLQALTLAWGAFGDAAHLRSELVEAAISRACLAEPLPRDEAAFRKRLAEARSRVTLIAQEVARLLTTVLDLHRDLGRRVQTLAKAYPAVARDVEAQMTRLVHRDFINGTPAERLAHLPRYLQGIALRIDKLRADPARDARLAAQIAPLEQQWQRALARARSGGGAVDPALEQFGWLLEELRVATFAQELRTPVPVSVKRLEKMWHTVGRP
jgi:ATP-dependent helicase HrpA